MPNYTTSKGVLPPCDEPAYLSVGTDVSAKYKGAFCEAKIIDTNRHVKLKVLFKGSTSAYLVNDDDLKEGYEIKIGNTIEAKNPDKANSFMHAIVTKVIDHSRYTVLFDDGDQSVLKRNSLRLKSGRHFAESETLDQLPLTNPEHFGNPVKVGLSETASSTNGKPLVNASANDSISLDESQPSTNLPKQTSDAGSSESSTSSSNKDSSSKKPVQHGPIIVNPIKGKRGGTRGRKRRDSTKDAPKSAQAPTESTEKESDDTSSENDETINKSIKFDSIEIGTKLKVKYGRGRLQKVYEAKVNKIELSDVGKYRYFVHYTGWNNRYDEWIPRSRIIDIVKDEPPKKKERIKERKEKIKEKDKDKDTNDEKLDKEKNVEKEVTEKEVKKEKVEEREKDTERKKDKQKDVELKRDKEKELEKQKEEEIERKKEKERDIEKKIKEKEREKEKEKEKEREREKETERLRELEEQRKAKELEELEKLEREKAREVEEAREREREKEEELEKKLKLEEEEEKKRLAKQEELEKKEKELAKEKEQQKQRVKDEHDKATREREKERDKKDKERQKERERQKESERVQPMEVEKEMVNVQASYSSLSDALDEKIYLLQERISILRRQYISLRSELAHIDRKRRRMAVT